jgi:hypothetical protein
MATKKDDVYFHTFTEDGRIINQGVILRELPLDHLEIQLFSFLTGEDTIKKIVDGKDYIWKFYTDHDDFIKAYEKNQEEHYSDL